MGPARCEPRETGKLRWMLSPSGRWIESIGPLRLRAAVTREPPAGNPEYPYSALVAGGRTVRIPARTKRRNP